MPKVKQFNQEKTLEKAMNIFWKSGYHATSIQDLVDDLGISRSSIYDTYGGKRELFKKAFQLYRTTNISGMTQFLKTQKSTKIGLHKLFEMAIQESVSDIDKKGCFVINTATELVPGDEEIQRILQENESIIEKIFYDFLLHGQQMGEIPKNKNLKTLSALLFTLYMGLRVKAKVQPNRDKMLSLVDTTLTLLD